MCCGVAASLTRMRHDLCCCSQTLAGRHELVSAFLERFQLSQDEVNALEFDRVDFVLRQLKSFQEGAHQLVSPSQRLAATTQIVPHSRQRRRNTTTHLT